jgi:hypothetical protein
MKYVLFDHQAKARAFVAALAPKYEAVARNADDPRNIKFVLTDNDVLSRVSRLNALRSAGVSRTFVYPHTARPSIIAAFYDLWPHTTAEFVSTDGHIEIMRRMGNNHKLHAVGWSLCPILPFKPRAHVYNVLFAPIHPRNSKIDRKLNQAVIDKLRPLWETDQIRLTVRYLIPFEGNGIVRVDHPNVVYVEGSAGPAWQQIDEADLVVSHQTFSSLGVARGVPTLMMGEGTPQHVEYRNGVYLEARGWSEYHHLIDYPLDLLAVDDARSLIQRAALTDVDIQDWKRRMIGEPFNPELFVSILESYL